jgi:myo-inositol-1(or 4)-monophosphatase
MQDKKLYEQEIQLRKLMKEKLISILEEAGKLQKQHFNKVHRCEQKESISSIITETDLLCDRFILDSISSDFPLNNILSEESGLIYKQSKYTWIVDPLDGTSNFAAGIPWFGVLIAILEDNLPVMAGAYIPMEEKLFFAEYGKGAFLNTKKLKIEDTLLKNVLFAFSTDYSDDKESLEKGLKLFSFLIRNTRNIRSTNSLVDFMLVAEGKLGGVVNMFTKIWDIAAPWLIIKEAGGALKHLDFSDITFEINKNQTSRNYPVISGSLSILNEFEKELKLNK